MYSKSVLIRSHHPGPRLRPSSSRYGDYMTTGSVVTTPLLPRNGGRIDQARYGPGYKGVVVLVCNRYLRVAELRIGGSTTGYVPDTYRRAGRQTECREHERKNTRHQKGRWMRYMCMRAEMCVSLCLFFRLVTCADPEGVRQTTERPVGL